MRKVAFALVLAAAVLVAGCGGDDDTAAGDSPQTTVDPDSAVSSPPNDSANDPDATVPDGGAERVVPTNSVVDPLPTSFLPEEAEAVDGGVVIRFYNGVAPCYAFDRYEVEETDTTVTVRLFTGASPEAAATTCIDLAQSFEVLVPLEAPLGDRTLIDGSV